MYLIKNKKKERKRNMSGTIYGGITRNGINIESEVDDHFDYIYRDERFNGYFARLAQMLREKGNFDTAAPAIAIFCDEEPYMPILAKPLDGDFDKYQDFFGQGNELCDKEVEIYWNEIEKNDLLEVIWRDLLDNGLIWRDERVEGIYARFEKILKLGRTNNAEGWKPAIAIYSDDDYSLDEAKLTESTDPVKEIILDGDVAKYLDERGHANDLLRAEVRNYFEELAQSDKISMTVYCDTTGQYSEKEVNEDNITEMEFPKYIVKEYFEKVADADCEYESFEEWLDDYTADDTEELYEFAEARGFKAKRSDFYDFKEGDKVRVLTLEKLEEKYGEAEEDGSIDTLGGYVFGPEMREFCGKTATVIDVDAYKVALRFDDPELSNPRQFVWTMNMLEPCTDYVSMERMKELLNLVVDHVCVARDSKEAIQKLLYIGFKKDELINVFHFGAGDVQDAEESMDEYEE